MEAPIPRKWSDASTQKASGATALVVPFIDGHQERFGVAPICYVLREHSCRIAPSTYYARPGRRFVTTRPGTATVRAPDLVNRDFTAPAPNRLWLVDLTYVPTWSGVAFTAFASDAFSCRIVGWRTAASMPTELPLDALEMALWTRHASPTASAGSCSAATP